MLKMYLYGGRKPEVGDDSSMLLIAVSEFVRGLGLSVFKLWNLSRYSAAYTETVTNRGQVRRRVEHRVLIL
jgi:hypothetical protein